MLTVDQARKTFIDSVAPMEDIETMGLDDALLRISAEDVTSSIAVPPTDNSAMDGFAINAADIAGSEVELEISQRIPAGEMPQPLQAGTAARIFTGGVMPANADAVVIQENCSFEDGGAYVKIMQQVCTGDNVRPMGQDIPIDGRIVSAGQKLTATDLGLLASVGCAQINVYRHVKVAIFSTGDELAEPGEELKPGQIYNSNRTMLLAICKQLGFVTIDCGIVEDTLAATQHALLTASEQADIIITSGGVSVGEEDHIKPAIEALGSLQHWKVQMKPGKPVVLGEVKGTPILGLPGNPVSSYIVFLLLGIPTLKALQGQGHREFISYKIAANFDKKEGSREEYIRAKLVSNESGELVLERFSNLSSGVLTSLSWADGLIRQPIGEAIVAGEPVEFLPLREGLI